jgi:hypothetical protein
MVSLFLERYKAIEYQIPDSDGAQKIVDKIVEQTGTIDPIRQSLYSQKIAQMATLEKSIMPGGKPNILSSIAPNSSFSTIFVFTFPRSRLSNQKFTLVFEAGCTGTLSESVAIQKISRSVPVSISPNPLVITLVGALAGLLGAIISASVSLNVATAPDFWNHAYHITFGAKGFVAAVLAGIMVNVFQFIFSEKMEKLVLDWRAAILIGALSGLFTNRVIAALQAFLGP